MQILGFVRLVFQKTVGHWCLKHLTMADSFVMLPNLVSSEAFVCFVKCTLHVSWDNWERVSANDEIISSLDGESHVLIIQFCHYHWGIFCNLFEQHLVILEFLLFLVFWFFFQSICCSLEFHGSQETILSSWGGMWWCYIYLETLQWEQSYCWGPFIIQILFGIF